MGGCWAARPRPAQGGAGAGQRGQREGCPWPSTAAAQALLLASRGSTWQLSSGLDRCAHVGVSRGHVAELPGDSGVARVDQSEAARSEPRGCTGFCRLQFLFPF